MPTNLVKKSSAKLAASGELALLQLGESAKEPAKVKAALTELHKAKKLEAERRRKERDALIAKVIEKEGEQALESISPLALSATLVEGEKSEQAFLRPVCELDWTLNPLFDAVMLKCGASKRGERTYAVQMHAKSEKNNFLAILKALPDRIVYDGATCDKLQRKGGQQPGWTASWAVRKLIQATPLGGKLSFTELKFIGAGIGNPYGSPTALDRGMICITVTGNELFIKVMTAMEAESHMLLLYPGAPDMHLWRRQDSKGPVKVTADVALAACGAYEDEGGTVQCDPKIKALEGVLKQSLVAQAVAGSPGEARVVVGSAVKKPSGVEFQPLFPGCTFAESAVTSALEAGKLVEASKVKSKALHGAIADVIAMEMAPTVSYDGLFDHQDEAVRRHLATQIGFLNACATGLGKSTMSAVGLRERAATIGDGYLALVSAQNSLVGQWLVELGRWFPAAHVFLAKTNNTKRLTEVLAAHAESPESPLVIVGSYGMVKKHLELFRSFRWNDLVVDEAAFLKNRSSQQSQTFWALRDYTDLAVALTGTPIDKGLDDLGSMLSWVRADESMFHSRRLSQRFDVSNDTDLKQLHQVIGPAMYRVDTAEAGVKMPSYKTHVEMVTAHKAELALAEGSRKHLKQIIVEQQNLLAEEAEKAEGEGDAETAAAYREAHTEMKSAQAGTLLGAVTLTRMSASDAISVQESESLGAAMLAQAGLVDPAVKHGGSKRRKAVEDIVERVEKGFGVLVFTDFVSAGERLVEELQEAGVRSRRFGGSSPEAIESCKADFQGRPCVEHAQEPQSVPGCPACEEPVIDVLVLGQGGQHGLNLQRAGVLVNYDLNWVPSRFLQRVGRASRIGALHDQLEILIYLVEGTIEERIAAVLVPRAMETLATLDLARGTDAKASVLSGLSQQIAINISEAEQEAAAEKTIFEMAKTIILQD